jgi:hypothetical protein
MGRYVREGGLKLTVKQGPSSDGPFLFVTKTKLYRPVADDHSPESRRHEARSQKLQKKPGEPGTTERQKRSIDK